MTRIVFQTRTAILATLLCLAVTASAQTSSSSSTTAPITFQSQSNLVVLDVVVTDSSGRPVHSLTAADFKVLEDNHPVTLQNFEEHTTVQPAPAPNLPPNTFTNAAPANAASGPYDVLLFDALNTPIGAQARLRQQVLAYIKTMPAGTHIAVFSLTDHLAMLQGFTTDPTLLASAVSRITPFADAARMDTLPHAVSPNTALSPLLETTLSEVSELARYLAAIPGRKNLLWFSGSFPLVILGGKPITHIDEIKATDDLLNRGHVAVYPIDARGIFSNPALNSSDPNEDTLAGGHGSSGLNLAPGGGGGVSHGHMPGDTTGGVVPSNTAFEETTADDHHSMQLMADETGGKANYKTNDLTAATRQAIDDGANFYTLTYVPTNLNLNGDYRHLKVDVDKPHVQLAYRHGYYADAASVTAQTAPASGEAIMQTAMQHGAPNLADLNFTVSINPAAATDDTIPAGNRPNPAYMHPPYRHLTITYADDVKNLKATTTPDGNHHADLELVAVLYNADGQTLNAVTSDAKLNVTDATWQQLLQQGLHIHQQLDAPLTGDLYLRIGFHDITTNQIGALEIPLSQIKLQP